MREVALFDRRGIGVPFGVGGASFGSFVVLLEFDGMLVLPALPSVLESLEDPVVVSLLLSEVSDYLGLELESRGETLTPRDSLGSVGLSEEAIRSGRLFVETAARGLGVGLGATVLEGGLGRMEHCSLGKRAKVLRVVVGLALVVRFEGRRAFERGLSEEGEPVETQAALVEGVLHAVALVDVAEVLVGGETSTDHNRVPHHEEAQKEESSHEQDQIHNQKSEVRLPKWSQV